MVMEGNQCCYYRLDTKIACVTVGLPARGKTYIAHKASRYLNWLGIPTRVFNVGQYRRKASGAQQPHNFFGPNNQQAELERRRVAIEALADLIDWLKTTEGQVAVYDATNSTLDRRKMVRETCEAAGISVLFIESICDNQDIIMDNIKEVKLTCPDYINKDPDWAVSDFKARIAHYAEAYQTIDIDGSEASCSFVKLVDVGTQAIINRVRNYRQSRIIFFVMNLHIKPRSIYIARHGETLHNLAGRIGGDADLSPNGLEFAKALPTFLYECLGESKQLTIWTSTLKRTVQTASYLNYPKCQWKALDEIDAGVCDGLTYEEIESRYPDDFAARDLDKFHFRYRSGESYADMVFRLDPVIMELERQENILIIGHQAILRAILAYFLDKSHPELPYIRVPLHTIFQLTPKAYGCEVKQFSLNIQAVDTHRSKPSKHGQ